MEKKLEKLFDYQRFEEHPGLRQVIDSVHNRYDVHELDLEDMTWVNAAGIPDFFKRKRRTGDR